MKRNARLKWMVMLMGMMLLALVFTACGKDGEGTLGADTASPAATGQASTEPEKLAPVKLKYYYYGGVNAGDQTVFDKINEIVKQKINATVEFIKIPNNGDYTQKMTIMVNAQEEFDLAFTSPDYLNYFDHAAKGSFVDLTQLLPKYAPKTYALFKPEIWNAAKVNGKIYASINQQIFARQAGYNISKPLADKYGFDPKGVTKLSDLQPFLEKVKAGEPADATDQLFNASINSHVFSYLYPSYQWETIGGTNVPGVASSVADKPVVFNEYDTPEFKEYVMTRKDFQAKGLIAKDVLTRPTFDSSKYAAATTATLMPGIEATLKVTHKGERYVIPLGQPMLTTYNAIATMTAVSSTSKNPERAVMFLELLNTDKDVYNLLTWGIEGVDYKKIGDNRVETLPDAKYKSSTGWMFGNQFNSFVSGTQTDDVWEQTKKLNDSATVSKIFGFNFTPDSVKTEIANCSAIVNEYRANFNGGMYGNATESKLAEYLAKLKTAGLDKIIAEKQKQLDAFMATKAK
ncbi:MAG: transporter substrate-binding protein [Paenibacillaceae bacterium]|jgi:putative aldouronate transport system substrate-binding protein|nr:transporter substrate-binding protein [Paenibacillaceae bacterium]